MDLNKRDLGQQMPSKDSMNVTSNDMAGVQFKIQSATNNAIAQQMVKNKTTRVIDAAPGNPQDDKDKTEA